MTDRYVVFGNPVRQSKSPFIHQAFAAATGHDIHYGLMEAPVGGFVASARAFRDAGGAGGNVTTPFKIDAFNLADQRMPRAELAGAVNCLKFEKDGSISADMFDGVGLANDLEHNLGVPLRGKRLLILGAGGAARGLIATFAERSPSAIVVGNRTTAHALSLVSYFHERGVGVNTVSGCGFDDLQRGAERFDVVLNATSASLRGELPDVDPSVYRHAAIAYELSYGKGLTPFLRAAQQGGAARVVDGVGMLVEQAAEAWVWWRGVRPATQQVIEHIRVPLV